MYKVLLANADIKKNSEYCNILANDKELQITATTDGLTALKKFFEIKPNILIFDTNIENFKCIEKLNNISIESNSENKSRTILTTNIEDADFYFAWGQEVSSIIETPINSTNF